MWNVVIQGGLLVAIQLNVVAESKSLLLGLQAFGIVLAFFWILSGVRLKSYTDYYIKRLKDFEKKSKELHDFSLFVDGEAETRRGVSKILYLRWIPFSLALAWLAMFIYTLATSDGFGTSISNELDLLSIATWLGILVIAVQYYVNNFLKPEKWKQFDNKEADPIKRENLKKRFRRKWDLVIFLLLGFAVVLGLLGIIAKLLN